MIERLRQLARGDAERVGTKAANLGELSRLGLPVPDGFVIDQQSASAFQNQVATEGLDAETNRLILDAFHDLRADRVAVRSSANVEDSDASSFAGVFESILNVGADGLVKAVIRCWSSAATARVLAYSDARGVLPTEIRVAVIVQVMVDADAAGVCFTSDPVTGDETRPYVEIVSGLGDALVAGRAAPDAYSFDSNSGRVVTIERGRNGAGDAVDLAMITRIVTESCRIRAHFGQPQDVEFAVEGGNIHYLQTRPISFRGSDDSRRDK
ncbi:MAG TPA: PEP/pyruvate-binding domain-containing protein [Gemmatimonadaceae bacterium]|nr:PEP/pyruvate-binding domain-containing protein [Gemmatimonadaceae bacterium]